MKINSVIMVLIQVIRWGAVPAILLILTVEDIRKMSVKGSMLLLGAFLLLAAGGFSEPALWERIGGMLVGGGIVILSFLTKEAIGMADALLFIAYGTAFGIWSLLLLGLFSFGAAAIWSGAMLATKKVGRKGRVPFLPFFTFGYLVLLHIRYFGLA